MTTATATATATAVFFCAAVFLAPQFFLRRSFFCAAVFLLRQQVTHKGIKFLAGSGGTPSKSKSGFRVGWWSRDDRNTSAWSSCRVLQADARMTLMIICLPVWIVSEPAQFRVNRGHSTGL